MPRSNKSPHERLFVESDDGRVVYFPFSPLCGYLLPRTTYREIITKTYEKSFSIFFPLACLSFLVCFAFPHLWLLILAANLAISFLIRHAMLARVKRRLWKLPLGIGFRFFARWRDRTLIWQNLLAGLSTTMVPFWGPMRPLLVFMACVGGYVAIENFAVLFSRYLQIRAEASELARLNSTSSGSDGGSFRT